MTDTEILEKARAVPVTELAGFIGTLATANAIAISRLTPAPMPVPVKHDSLISIEEAARRLGVSKDYIYRNHSRFDFARREGRRLLFSAKGIDEYIDNSIRRKK